MRARLGIVAVAALMLTGCVAPAQPPATPAASTGAPSPAATADDPAATPSAAAIPPASTTPAATATAPEVEDAPYCGDAHVLARLSGGPTSWIGTDAEVLAQAEAGAGFEPAEAIAGLAVHCTVTYRSPTDGGSGVVTISEALLLRDDAALGQLDAWSTANGYAPAPGSDPASYGERYAPANADGTTTTKLFWAPLDGDTPTLGDAPQIVAMTGAPPDAILVWFADFTQQ